MLKRKLKKEQGLHRKHKELHLEQVQQEAQHVDTDETVPIQVIDPSSSRHGPDMVKSVVNRMQGYSGAWMSLCARMRSHPSGTLTEAKTRSKSD